MAHLTPEGGAPQGKASPGYTVVTQAKSFRVVYFTDDPAYTPPMDGDWYYAASYQGALPEGMTLRNCWGWRFNGETFVAAQDLPPPCAQQALLDHNRRALLRILRDKIDALRAPYLPAAALGEQVRGRKLQEARDWLAGASTRGTYPFLEGVAVARNISIADAAQLVTKRAEQADQMLAATERVREKFTELIAGAPTEETLLQLRVLLLDDVYPELSKKFNYPADYSEPQPADAPLSATHRCHEIARLRAQLREKINGARAGIDSQYLQNDAALKVKAQLARMLVSNQGQMPAKDDLALLENYAQARGIELKSAAELILNSMAAAGQVLIETEKTKDRLLARIDGLRTREDIQAVADEIALL